MKKKRIREKEQWKLAEYGLTLTNTRNVSRVEYDYGETLMELNDPLENLLIIEQGTVRVCAETPNGKNLILCYYVSDGMLGDMEFLSEDHRISTAVIAGTPVTAVMIPFKENAELLENNLVFMRHLAHDLADKLIQSSRNYTASALNTAEQRLARYIRESSRNGMFSEVMTDVALSTGMSYRHMYRILDHLCTEKVLQKTESGYRILDRERLSLIEEGNLR